MTLTIMKSAAVAVAVLTFWGFSTTGANAQSGLRLCGYVAVATPVKIGLLYEAHQKDASYKKQCSKVISEMWDAIKKDASLSKMSWTKIDKKACEDVGKMGFGENGKNDICDKMKAKTPYKVLKMDKLATTYTKM